MPITSHRLPRGYATGARPGVYRAIGRSVAPIAPTLSPGGVAEVLASPPALLSSVAIPRPSEGGPSKKALRRFKPRGKFGAPAMVEYAPGVCNIGPRGRIERAAFGIAAIVFAVGLWHLVRLNALPSWPVLLLFFPLVAGFIAVFESLFGFCVIFARQGVYDLR